MQLENDPCPHKPQVTQTDVDTSESQPSVIHSIMNTVNAVCPFSSLGSVYTWGRNSFKYLHRGLVKCIEAEMQINGDKESFYPIKNVPIAHRPNLYVITDLKLTKKLLQKLRYGDDFSGGSEFKALSQVIGANAPLTETNIEAQKQEKRFANTEQFGPAALEDNANLFFQITEKFIKENFNLEKEDVFNISEIIPKYPTAVSSKIIFNLHEGLQNFDLELKKFEQVINDALLYRIRTFLPGCMDIPRAAAKKNLEETVIDIINANNEGNDNFISKMCQNKAFNEQQVKSMIKTILIIGSGTTKSTLISAIYCLLNNPEYQEELYESISKIPVTKDSKNKEIRENLIKNPEIERFLLEVMRLHAPIPIQARTTVKEMKIEDYTIPEKTTIFFANFLSYRDKKSWDKPNDFNPSRFKDERNKRDFLPFNIGKNLCMGKFFANYMLVNFIYHLLINYKIVPPVDSENIELEQKDLSIIDSFTFTFNENVYVRLVKR